MEICSVNGRLNGTISPLNRGLAYGDGVFETLRVVNGQILLWHYHQQRLIKGCQRLQIPLDQADLNIWVDELLDSVQGSLARSAVMKVVVSRGTGGRGYRPDLSLSPDVVLTMHPFEQVETVPAHLCICNYRLPSNSNLAGIKHLNRLDNVMLQAECLHRGFDDGLVMDNDDNVVEATSSNVFFESAGVLYTPDLNHCGVEGVMRRFIIEELSPSLGLEVIIEPIKRRRLSDFDSAFCCNSVRGLVPIASAGEFQFVQTAAQSKLQQRLSEYDY